MFISGFISGLVAQSELSQLLDELFGSFDLGFPERHGRGAGTSGHRVLGQVPHTLR
jgi:hypothetical protein